MPMFDFVFCARIPRADVTRRLRLRQGAVSGEFGLNWRWVERRMSSWLFLMAECKS